MVIVMKNQIVGLQVRCVSLSERHREIFKTNLEMKN